MSESHEDVNSIKFRLEQLHAEFRAYDGGDRPMSPPAWLIRDLANAQVALEAAIDQEHERAALAAFRGWIAEGRLLAKNENLSIAKQQLVARALALIDAALQNG